MFEYTRNSLVLGISLLAGFACPSTSWAQGPTPGQNVNMVSGTKWPGGDPFLQRQNEPSIAVSTRNPQHLLAGANDYRTVDLNPVDQLPINQLSGDAWLGVFKSFDGGQRWQSTLLPGFPQDRSAFGANSPMKGFGAASDPVVRAGTNGMFYYSSIALNRGTNVGALFLSRFIDLNNKENGDAAQSNYPSPPSDPIRYIGTVEVDSGNAGQFIDKPWLAVDIPRTGAGTCTIQVPQDNGASVTQSFPAGNVYMAYAMFVGGTINVRSKINFTKSSDCGQTWTKPTLISQTYDISQGTQVAVDPETGYVYVAWRVFSGSGNDLDAMVVTKSVDGGNTFSKAVSVRSLSPFNAAVPSASASFDQNTTGTEFRTQSMPTIAVDDSGSSGTPGNIYVAWSERGVPPTGDARIMISTSRDGATWSAPKPVDNYPLTDDVGDQFTRGHQLMPAMTFTGGKLMLVYYDLRLDHTTGRFTPNTPFGPDNKGEFFEESRPYLGDDPTKVFTPFVDDGGLAVRRHTIDVNVAQSNGGLNPSFTSARLSRYDFGQPGPDPGMLQLQQLEQLKVNPPNLPMFSQGTVPFMGDYLDVAGLMFVALPGGTWTFNNPLPPSASSSSPASKPTAGSPIFYGSWTSNQDVIPPADGNWTKYSAVPLPSQTASIFNGQPLPPCAAGWEGDRNQNIYESRITQGLLVSSPQNSKPLSTTLQRSFVILLQNSTNFQKTFQLSIANQPPGNFSVTGQKSPGGFASFEQAVPNQPSLPNPLPAPVTSEFAAIPAHSGAPRTVFALSSNPTASITVNVNEVDSTGKVISGGLSSFIVLNADGTVPPLTNPDGAPTGSNIAGVEIYDPNITAPNITAPSITAPNITAPNITAPNITAPNITAPNITAPNITAPNITATSVTNPNITAPNITAGSIADATYTVTNAGNTTVEYHVKLAGGASGANAKVPLQLTVNQIYTTPTSFQCQLIPQQQNITYINVVNPEFTPLNQLSNPNITAADPSEATIYLAPGDSALITLRGQTDVATMQSIVTQIAPVVVPKAVNTNSTATAPTFAAPPFITTASLPNGVTGVPFSAALQAIGGTAPYTWGVRFGNLPAGLNLNPSTGLISGTPTVSNLPGTSITFQAQDAVGRVVTRSLTIAVAPPLLIPPPLVLAAPLGVSYSQTLSVTGGTPPVTWSIIAGSLPPGMNLDPSTGLLSGTPTAAGTFNFTLQARDSASPPQVTTFPLTLIIQFPVSLGFVTQPTATTAGQPISPAIRVRTLDGTGAAIPGTTITLGMGSGPNRPILSGTLSAVTDATGIATFSNVILDRAGTGFTLIATVSGVSSSGAVQLIPAPPSVQLGALESDTQIQLFGERHRVSLSSGVAVDITAPGSYTSTAGVTSGTIPAGTLVDSYYLHADPVGISQNIGQMQAGAVTFPTDVLGLIVLDPELSASDSAVGVSGTLYPAGGRALELGSPGDTAILSADRRTLTLHLSNSGASDDVRVITAANANLGFGQTTSATFSALAGSGFITTVAGSTWVFPSQVSSPTNAPLGLGADFIGGTVGVIADSVGNVYVADPNNQMVFKISSGKLSIVAGTGVEGYSGDGGPAVSARLDFPDAVALSPSGELYILDTGNSVVRKVDATGKITTVVGNGVPAYTGDGGQAVNASLNGPEGMSFDAAGNLFVADSNNGVVRRVDTTGIITTVPVTSTPANFGSGLFSIQQVAAGPGGSLYITLFSANQVFRLDAGGSLTIVAGNGSAGYSGDGGPAVSAELSDPSAITLDSTGNIYIADEFNNVVRKVDTAGTITTVVGNGGLGFSGDGGSALLATMAQPGALAFDPFGNLYIGDTTNERIRKVDTSGTITTIAGNGRFKYAGDGGPATSASLDAPIGTTVDPFGNLFASDIANEVVRKIDPAGLITTFAGTGFVAPAYTGDGDLATLAPLLFPNGVKADGAGNVYLTEGGRVHKITASGIISTLAGGPSNSGILNGVAVTGLFSDLHVALDSQGNVYLSGGNQVFKLDTTGTLSVVAGSTTLGPGHFSGDGGPATLAKLSNVRDVAVDLAGNIYIADDGNRRVRRVDTTGIITTVAGNGSFTASGDGGPATSAGVPSPFALTVDGAGNLFIGSGSRVRKVDASGIITTIAGGGFIGLPVDGIPATNAAFTNVQGLAFDAAGNLYVTDRFNDRVRKITGVTNAPPFIFNPPAGLTVTTKGLPSGNLGSPYFQTLSAVGGAQPYGWRIISGALPAGLNISNAGAISGTPTASGAFNFTVQVTDSTGATATQSLTITLNLQLAITTASLPDGVIGVAYSQALTATGGAGSYIWTRASGTFPPDLTLSTGGVLSGTPTTPGTYSFSVMATDSLGQSASASYTVIIATTALAGAHVLFIVQPPGPTGGGSTGLQAVAQVFDANNAPVSGVQLTGSFGNKACPDATLSGAISAVTDSNGLAAFSGITANRGGYGYTAVASATSNPAVSVTSIPFNIQGFCPTGNLTTLRRENTVALLPNGKVLILGGINSNTVSASVALNTAELYDPATGVFTATSNMTTPRDLATATVLPNGKLLIAGGYDATTTTLASAELYDPSTGVFTATGSMSVPRQEHAATLLPNGRVLITGGAKWAFPTTFYASAEIYDPATGLFTLTGTMNSPHVDHTATLLSNGKVLVVSGEGSTNPDTSNQQITSSAELYDPSAGTFTPTGSMATGRFNQAATSLSDGRVLVTGGYSDVNASTATASAEIYDPLVGTFSPTGNMTVARAEHTSTLLPNGTVLIGGGFSSGGFFSGVQLSTAETYDPSSGVFKGIGHMAFAHSRIVAPLLPNGTVLLASGTNAEVFLPTDPPFQVQEFTATGSLNAARWQQTATLLNNGLVLFTGGFDNFVHPMASAELYNPTTGTFASTGSLSIARASHTATLLKNGLVLIAGGEGSSGVLASAELYNPTTGTFTSTGSLSIARASHTATLLNNGMVLIAGGIGSSGISASAELYNPATGTFVATGALNTAHYSHTATLLNNGLVLIAGGGNPSSNFSAVTELYDSGTGTFATAGGLNTARIFHTATLLNSGMVLIVGGEGSSGVLASAELYDPTTGTSTSTGSMTTARDQYTATLLYNGMVLIAGGVDSSGRGSVSAELYNPASGIFAATSDLNTAYCCQTATLLPTGKVLVAGGEGNTGVQAASELYQSGAIQQLQPLSCGYEGHIKSVAAFSTPTEVRFVNNSSSLTFQIFWLDYNGNRVLYATLGPRQSYLQQTFLTHPWVIADTSPAATCQEIYLPLQEQAPAIFPPGQ